VRASEPTSDLCLQLKVMLAMSQVAPEELRALLKNVISEASTDLDVEPSSSDEESAPESSVASDTVQEMETDDDGNEGNRTGAGNAGTDEVHTALKMLVSLVSRVSQVTAVTWSRRKSGRRTPATTTKTVPTLI